MEGFFLIGEIVTFIEITIKYVDNQGVLNRDELGTNTDTEITHV